MQFGIRDCESCDNCDEIETISHLLYDCPFAQTIWKDAERWFRNVYTQEFHTDKTPVLLGNAQNEIIINYILTVKTQTL